MCGIAGIIYRDGTHEVGRSMTRMLQSMKHRGPDSTGYALYRPFDHQLVMRYKLADLAANAWCRDANAAIAAYWLSTRRTGTAPAHLQQQFDTYVATLERIVAGLLRVPEAAESHEAGPAVISNS